MAVLLLDHAADLNGLRSDRHGVETAVVRDRPVAAARLVDVLCEQATRQDAVGPGSRVGAGCADRDNVRALQVLEARAARKRRV
jgi:hypothetical protein